MRRCAYDALDRIRWSRRYAKRLPLHDSRITRTSRQRERPVASGRLRPEVAGCATGWMTFWCAILNDMGKTASRMNCRSGRTLTTPWNCICNEESDDWFVSVGQICDRRCSCQAARLKPLYSAGFSYTSMHVWMNGRISEACEESTGSVRRCHALVDHEDATYSACRSLAQTYHLRTGRLYLSFLSCRKFSSLWWPSRMTLCGYWLTTTSLMKSTESSLPRSRLLMRDSRRVLRFLPLMKLSFRRRSSTFALQQTDNWTHYFFL